MFYTPRLPYSRNRMKRIQNIAFFLFLLFSGIKAVAQNKTVLTWQDCVNEAAKNNPEVAASAQAILQNKAQRWVTGSAMLPQVTSSAGIKRSDTFSGGDAGNRYNYSVKIDQLLFDGLKTYKDIKSATQDIRASEYSYISTSAEVRYNLRKAFIDLLKAQELVPISESIMQRRKQNLGMIKLRYESGREHKGSLLLAEADLAQAEYDLKKARHDISVAEYALRKELGWNNNIPVRVNGDFKIGSAGKEPDLKTLAENHPLVKKSGAERSSAKYSLDSARLDFFPEINLNAEVGKMSSGITTNEGGWSVGATLSLPIFEGGQRIANERKAKAEFKQMEFNERGEYNAVLSSLEDFWRGLQDATENAAVQKKYLEAYEERSKISRSQYENGLLAFDNWVIIEDNYVRAEKSYLNAEADLLLAEAEWVRAKGGALNHE